MSDAQYEPLTSYRGILSEKWNPKSAHAIMAIGCLFVLAMDASGVSPWYLVSRTGDMMIDIGGAVFNGALALKYHYWGEE